MLSNRSSIPSSSVRPLDMVWALEGVPLNQINIPPSLPDHDFHQLTKSRILAFEIESQRHRIVHLASPSPEIFDEALAFVCHRSVQVSKEKIVYAKLRAEFQALEIMQGLQETPLFDSNHYDIMYSSLESAGQWLTDAQEMLEKWVASRSPFVHEFVEVHTDIWKHATCTCTGCNLRQNTQSVLPSH